MNFESTAHYDISKSETLELLESLGIEDASNLYKSKQYDVLKMFKHDLWELAKAGVQLKLPQLQFAFSKAEPDPGMIEHHRHYGMTAPF